MPSTDPLNGIIVFVTAVRARSFTVAAERLGISKSAVGKSVARLEDRLDAKLFYRTTRKLSLTADGEAFYQTCSEAIEEILAAEGALAARDTAPTGRMRIDMPAAFGRRILLPVLLDIARPHSALHLTLSFSDRIIDPVAEGIDLVVRFGEVADQAGLVMRKLTSQRLCICGSPAYLAAQGVPKDLVEVSQHRCIVNLRRDTPFCWRVLENGVPGRITPPATHKVGDGDAIVGLTLAGFGLSQMPMSLVSRYLASGELISVLQSFSQVMVPIHVLWPQPDISCRVSATWWMNLSKELPEANWIQTRHSYWFPRRPSAKLNQNLGRSETGTGLT